MLYAAIIEEDKDTADYLKIVLSQWTKGKTQTDILEWGSFAQARLAGPEGILSCDIVFMDIDKGHSQGVAAAKQLRAAGYQGVLILVSDSNEQAVEGYKTDAYRYFLKPVQPEDVRECMDYALDKKATDYFQYAYRGRSGQIAFREILYFESMLHYIEIHTIAQKIRIKGVLKEIQEKCPSYFIRCQRSYLVNVHAIVSRKGREITLQDGTAIKESGKLMYNPLFAPSGLASRQQGTGADRQK